MRRESLHLRLGAHPPPCCSPWSIHRGQATRVSNTSPDTPGVRSPRVPEEGGYIPTLPDEMSAVATATLRSLCVSPRVYSDDRLSVPSFFPHPTAPALSADVFRYKCETSLVRTSAGVPSAAAVRTTYRTRPTSAIPRFFVLSRLHSSQKNTQVPFFVSRYRVSLGRRVQQRRYPLSFTKEKLNFF